MWPETRRRSKTPAVDQRRPSEVVFGQHADRLTVGQVLHDLAGVAATEPRDVAGDLGEQLRLIESGGDVERGLHQGLELALAGPPRFEVAAVADRAGKLRDVVALDAAVAARRCARRAESPTPSSAAR